MKSKTEKLAESAREWKLADSATMDGQKLRSMMREHASLLVLDEILAEQRETNRLLRDIYETRKA